MLFCSYMTFIYVPRDVLLKPTLADEEVWFGIVFHGVVAKLLGLVHWLVYGAGLYGFWRMREWMWPWAAVYAAQVAFSATVWPLLYRRDARGLVTGALIAFVALALWRSRDRFRPTRP